MKKHQEISSSNTSVPKILIICFTVPEIWCVTDVIIFHFYPSNNPKMKISEEWKKHLEVSSFNTSVPKTMIICFTVLEIWCVTYVIVILILGYFLHFCALTAQKIKISKKWKKMLGDIIIYTSVLKFMIKCYTVPETWCLRIHEIIFHFGLFFLLLSH